MTAAVSFSRRDLPGRRCAVPSSPIRAPSPSAPYEAILP